MQDVVVLERQRERRSKKLIRRYVYILKDDGKETELDCENESALNAKNLRKTEGNI